MERAQSDQRAANGSSNAVVSHGMLLGLVQGFTGNAASTGKAIRDVADRSPQRFVDAACLVLREDVPETGRNFLIALMMERDVFLKALSDPQIFSRDKALDLAHVVHRTYPNIEAQLLRQALQGLTGPGVKEWAESDWEKLSRVLEILAHLGHTMRVMPILSNLLRSANTSIRLKAAPLVIRTIRSPQWLRELASDDDGRVRAAAAEAFLTVTPLPEELDILHKLADDPNPRVSTMVLIALSLHGDRDMAEKRLSEFCHHSDPAFRAAAAWAMGKTGNPHFVPELQRMVREEQGEAKRMAFLSCVSLRKEQATPNGHEAA